MTPKAPTSSDHLAWAWLRNLIGDAAGPLAGAEARLHAFVRDMDDMGLAQAKTEWRERWAEQAGNNPKENTDGQR